MPGSRRSRATGLLGIAVLLSGALLLGACGPTQFPGYAVVSLEAGPDLEDRLRAAVLIARPGTIIDLPAGHYAFRDELAVQTSHIVLRGKGMYETVLDFANQRSGAQGILATADHFAVQNLAVEDAKGDGIRAEGVDGLLFEQVRVEWTNGPASTNGSYGLYPVGSRNVVIRSCIVKGASDAGIYVGQSFNIVVRQNDVQYNVAGIEIENSQDADVFLNVTTKNTGGILVFDLKNPVKGMRSRVFANLIFDNNTDNFAPQGNIVANVPKGTGILIMANRQVEVFGNLIDDHQTASVEVVSHEVLNLPNRKLRNYGAYDPYPESIHIHHNLMTRSGASPSGDLGLFAYLVFLATGPEPMPHVIYDGILENDVEVNTALPEAQKFPLITEKTDPATGKLRADRRLCLDGNDADGSLFGDFNELRPPGNRDASGNTCSHPPLAEAQIAPWTAPPVVADPYTPEEVAALCGAAGAGVNWAAFVVSCPRLSDYRLFENGDPTGTPRDGGIPYDLTTPLFSDYAEKYRVLFVPPGQRAGYHEKNVLSLPVGTILVKSFTFRSDLQDPASPERLVETRLLIHRPEGWRGLPYVWSEDGTEAFFTPLGTAVDVTYQKDGAPVTIDYRVPNVTQCTQCHAKSTEVALGDQPIGPKARLLNKPYPYPGQEPENQLAHWQRVGALDVTAEQLAAAPRLPVWNDPGDGTLEERARAYLESNCAHCHDPAGRARFSSLFLEADRPIYDPGTGELDRRTGFCKAPVAAGVGSGDQDFDIVPGDPAASILPFRMRSLDLAARMPELSKAIVHDEGVALVEDWIASLPFQDCIQ